MSIGEPKGNIQEKTTKSTVIFALGFAIIIWGVFASIVVQASDPNCCIHSLSKDIPSQWVALPRFLFITGMIGVALIGVSLLLDGMHFEKDSVKNE